MGAKAGAGVPALQSGAGPADDTGVVMSGAEPEVAIVVPCYRYAHLLPEAVQSAVAQTWRNLRIVIVDDGSPDDTAAVAARLIASHPERRIELVRQANQGLAAARNAGVRSCQSPLLLPLDADDRLVPDAVARLVAALQAADADVATPLGRTFGDEDRPLVTLPVTRRRLCAGNCLVYSSLFRRSLFDAVGGYRPELRAGYEDWDFWLAGLARGARFTHVAAELFHYRRHGATMLSSADRQALELRAAITAQHAGLFPAWRVWLARRVLAVGGRATGWLRLGMLATLVCDRRLRQCWRLWRGAPAGPQATDRRATNMLST